MASIAEARSPQCISVILIAIIITSVESSVDQPSVSTPAGVIQGTTQIAPDGRPYYAFFGIPFAKPPVGELRFAKPQMHPPFESPFNASSFGKFCVTPQQGIAVYDSGNSEDCLSLNIFTSATLPGEKKRKVMVFIHGGGFHFGTAALTIPGSLVVEHDIIMVTIQYRLGVLGFFSLENEASPGNYGLWDQVLAIQWVKDNIEAFGGDSDDITIGGVSAGAASVGHLSFSPAATGLFTKAFAMSGTSTTGFSLSLNPRTHALEMAKKLKCWDGDVNADIDVSTGEEIIACLRTRSTRDIATNASFWVVYPRFLPSVDGNFIPQNPLKLVNSPDFLTSIGFFDRKYLITLSNNDKSVYDSFFGRLRGTSLENVTYAEALSASFEPLCEGVEFFMRFRYDLDKPPSRSVVERVANWYENRYGTDGIVQLFTDLGFPVPSLDFAKAATLGDASLWLLLQDHYPSYLKGQSRGMLHVLDMLYLFDMDISLYDKYLFTDGVEGPVAPEDEELKKTYQHVIADFMKYGDPSISLTKNILAGGWPKYEAQGQTYLSFSTTPKLGHRITEGKRRFWWETIPDWLKHSQNHEHTEL